MNRALRLILCSLLATTLLAASTGCSRSDNGPGVGQAAEAQTEGEAQDEAAAADDTASADDDAQAGDEAGDEASGEAGDEASREAADDAQAGSDAVVPGDLAADLCADFLYQLCRTDADCPTGRTCQDVTDACRAGTCSCDPATGEPGICTRDCRSGFGLCQRP